MTDDRIYYDGFERVKAARVDSFDNRDTYCDWVYGYHACADELVMCPKRVRWGESDYRQRSDSEAAWSESLPDQWLIKRADGRITVQDDEPVYVAQWRFDEAMGERYPILSNGWTGPWEPVD